MERPLGPCVLGELVCRGGEGGLPAWPCPSASARAHGLLRAASFIPSSLKKMTVGMFLASMAVAAAIVQVDIDVSCLLILQWPLLVGRGACPPPGLRL